MKKQKIVVRARQGLVGPLLAYLLDHAVQTHRARFRGQCIGFVRRLLGTLGNHEERQMRVVNAWISVIGFSSRRPLALRFHVSIRARDDRALRTVPSH